MQWLIVACSHEAPPLALAEEMEQMQVGLGHSVTTLMFLLTLCSYRKQTNIFLGLSRNECHRL